jgi:hypothetical protein
MNHIVRLKYSENIDNPIPENITDNNKLKSVVGDALYYEIDFANLIINIKKNDVNSLELTKYDNNKLTVISQKTMPVFLRTNRKLNKVKSVTNVKGNVFKLIIKTNNIDKIILLKNGDTYYINNNEELISIEMPADGIELFTLTNHDKENDSVTKYLFIILIILLALFIYKKYQKKIDL